MFLVTILIGSRILILMNNDEKSRKPIMCFFPFANFMILADEYVKPCLLINRLIQFIMLLSA